MTISILTLFPEVFKDYFSTSIIGRAVRKKLVKINLINIRDFASDKHKTVDDKPYGGGTGMILRVDVVEKAIAKTRYKIKDIRYKEKVVLFEPAGELFSQKKAREYVKLNHLILVCGHYEGVDARVSHFVDETISIGEYVLTGGEVPAMTVTDAVVRLLPDVLSPEATKNESFSKEGLFESPQYTRPGVYKGYKVPDILLSGNHQEIANWKRKHSIKEN